MEVDVQVERAPESLDDGHRAAAPVPHPSVPRAALKEPENRPYGTPHHAAAEGVIPGEPVAKPVRQAEDPLAHRYARQHVVDEMGGALGHAASAATRAQRAALAGERDEPVESAPDAAEPGEPRAQGAALQKLVKLLLHEAREALAVAQVGRLRAERLEVIAHDLVEDTGCRLPRFVGRRRGAHAPRSAEPMPRRASPETWGGSGVGVSGCAISARVMAWHLAVIAPPVCVLGPRHCGRAGLATE